MHGVSLLPEDEATAFKHRIDPNGPILPMPPARLGVVEGDRQLTIIAYRAPTVLVSVKTEDGAVPEELSVMARYTIEVQGYVSQFVRQPDGRFRSQSLMPDHEYAITVRGRRDVYDLAPPSESASLRVEPPNCPSSCASGGNCPASGRQLRPSRSRRLEARP